MEGLLLGMDMSPDCRYIVAYSNNNHVVILDNSSTHFKVIPNPFTTENVVGVRMKEQGFLVYGPFTCVFYNLEGEEENRNSNQFKTKCK